MSGQTHLHGPVVAARPVPIAGNEADGRSDEAGAGEPPRVIGILGGMGPAATAAFYSQVIAAVRAEKDQEHPTVAIWADASVPDRSAAILGLGKDPSLAILSGLHVLERLGATVITVPCNTAHYFVRRLAGSVEPPVIDMISETCSVLAARAFNRVGLLGTAGLVRTALYQGELESLDVKCITSSESGQSLVTHAIATVKKGGSVDDARRCLVKAARELEKRGCEAVIAGCTEIPLALFPDDLRVPLVNPSAILAQSAVASVGSS